MQRLIKHAGALVHVDNHGRPALATEVALEESSELTLAEWNNPRMLPGTTTI